LIRQRALAWIALEGLVVDDETVGVVGDLGLSAELGGLVDPPFLIGWAPLS
jgi:hypothetical protein